MHMQIYFLTNSQWKFHGFIADFIIVSSYNLIHVHQTTINGTKTGVMNDECSADKYYHKKKLFCEKNASLRNQGEKRRTNSSKQQLLRKIQK